MLIDATGAVPIDQAPFQPPADRPAQVTVLPPAVRGVRSTYEARRQDGPPPVSTMHEVLHATPFLPSPGLREAPGSFLTYSPSFIDLGKLKLRVETMHIRWCAVHGRTATFSTEFLQKAVEEVRSMVRGKVRVTATTPGHFTLVASDNWGTYHYEFDVISAGAS